MNLEGLQGDSRVRKASNKPQRREVQEAHSGSGGI
jgi:hypothetical protein